MNERNDDRFARELQDAYGRDLPAEELDRAVLERIEKENGGVHEVSVSALDRRRYWPLAVAAAAVLLAIAGLKALPDLIEPEPAPNYVVENAGPGEEGEPLVITLIDEDEVMLGDKVVKIEALTGRLAEKLAALPENDPERPANLHIVIRATRETAWRQVQTVVQCCSDPKVRVMKVLFTTTKTVRTPPEEEATPEESDEPFDGPVWPAKIQVEVSLKRTQLETETRVILAGKEIGKGNEGFVELKKRIAASVEGKDPIPAARIEAYALVPHAEVIRAIDALMAAKITAITFVGAPPPRTEPATLRVWIRGGAGGERLRIAGVEGSHSLEVGLEKLAEKLRAMKEAGRKPRGMVEIEMQISGDALRKVLDVFEEAGLEAPVLVR